MDEIGMWMERGRKAAGSCDVFKAAYCFSQAYEIGRWAYQKTTEDGAHGREEIDETVESGMDPRSEEAMDQMERIDEAVRAMGHVVVTSVPLGELKVSDWSVKQACCEEMRQAVLKDTFTPSPDICGMTLVDISEGGCLVEKLRECPFCGAKIVTEYDEWEEYTFDDSLSPSPS